MAKNANCNLHKSFVFISCFLSSFIHGGLISSFGTIFMDIMLTFNTSRAETAIIQSTAMTVMMVTGFISGTLIHKFGTIRCGIVGASLASIGLTMCFLATSTLYMTISFGILHAFGSLSCLYMAATIAICQTFEDNKRMLMLMLSLRGTAIAAGGMMYPRLLAYLSDMYGFRGALLIVGGVSMNCIPGCLLWKPPKITKEIRVNPIPDRLREYQERTSTKVTNKGDEIVIETSERVSKSNKNGISYIDTFPILYDKFMTRRISVQEGNGTTHEGSLTVVQTIKDIVKNTRFMIFTIGLIVATPTSDIIFIFVTEIFIDKGLTMNDVTFGLFLMNIVNLFARLLPGAMVQSKRIPTLFCPLFASLAATLILAGFARSTSRTLTLGILAAAGIPIGMFNTMYCVIVTKLVGVRKTPTALGLAISANAVGNAIAGPVSGYIRDISGSYNIPFYLAASMAAFATIIFFIGMVLQKVKDNHERRRSSLFYLTSM